MSIPRSNELIKRSGDKIKIAGRVEYLAALRRQGIDLDTLAKVLDDLMNPPEGADPGLESIRLRAVAVILNHVLGMKKVAGDKTTPNEDEAILEEMKKNFSHRSDLSINFPHREDLIKARDEGLDDDS